MIQILKYHVIFELETFLSISERGDLKEIKGSNYIYSENILNQYYEKYDIDICDSNNFPKGKILKEVIKKHNTISLKLQIEKTKKQLGNDNNDNLNNDSNKPKEKLNNNNKKDQNENEKKVINKQRQKRVLREMNLILKNGHPFWDIYIEENNIYFWKLILVGPETTPYDKSIFLLYCNFPEDLITSKSSHT